MENLYPITYFVNNERFSLRPRNFVVAVTTGRESKNFKDTIKYSGWCAVMVGEIWASKENEIWFLQKLSYGKKALTSKLVYKIKHHSNEIMERLKGRLVIFGHHLWDELR